jgi:hypothetical protein
MPSSLVKTVAVSAVLCASVAFAANSEKKLSLWPAPSSCKSDAKKGAEGACPKTKRVIFESLKGASEKTTLPETARLEARGGILI